MNPGNGQNNGDTGRRLTRLEEFVEVLTNAHIEFVEEHKKLLTAQILLTDQMKETDRRMKETDQRLKELKEQSAHTDERLGILIKMMDEWIRRHPLQ